VSQGPRAKRSMEIALSSVAECEEKAGPCFPHKSSREFLIWLGVFGSTKGQVNMAANDTWEVGGTRSTGRTDVQDGGIAPKKNWHSIGYSRALYCCSSEQECDP
jgi:hypothetical protein